MTEFFNQEAFVALLRLLASHIIVDFLLQPDDWVKEKNNKKFRSKTLYYHGIISGILAYVLGAKWNALLIPIIIAISHIIIDGWKSYKPATSRYFIIDQFLHIIIILLVWNIYFNTNYKPEQIFIYLFNDIKFWIIVSGYMLALWPIAFLISFATKQWREQIEQKDRIKSLGDAGKWIGRIERFLIVTFVLLGRFDAIGFLIAAKSVFRFGDVKDSNDRREAEYILIGTLMSFALALVLGIVMRQLLNL